LAINSWHETKEIVLDVKWFLFFVAVILGIVDHFIVSLVFQTFLKKYNMAVPYSSVGKMYFFGQMSKYIPGRFWNIVYQRSFIEKTGAISSLFVVNIELLAVFMVRNIIISLVLIFAGIEIFLAVGIYASGVLGFWLIGRSGLLVRGLYWLGERVKRPIGEIQCHANLPDHCYLFILYIAATITFLSSNFLMMYATFNYIIDASYLYIAFLGLAWVIGVLTFVIPAGIGVREVAFVALASLSGVNVSLETLAAIAIVHRFWHILQEIGGLLFVALLSLLKRYRIFCGASGA
jgi:uncharacterized membrane protein YbhN (UPF0104 family)